MKESHRKGVAEQRVPEDHPLRALRVMADVIPSRSRGEPRHATPGENRAVTSAQRTFNECGGFLPRSALGEAHTSEAEGGAS
jgi:hypothetical protein